MCKCQNPTATWSQLKQENTSQYKHALDSKTKYPTFNMQPCAINWYHSQHKYVQYPIEYPNQHNQELYNIS